MCQTGHIQEKAGYKIQWQCLCNNWEKIVLRTLTPDSEIGPLREWF